MDKELRDLLRSGNATPERLASLAQRIGKPIYSMVKTLCPDIEKHENATSWNIDILRNNIEYTTPDINYRLDLTYDYDGREFYTLGILDGYDELKQSTTEELVDNLIDNYQNNLNKYLDSKKLFIQIESRLYFAVDVFSNLDTPFGHRSLINMRNRGKSKLKDFPLTQAENCQIELVNKFFSGTLPCGYAAWKLLPGDACTWGNTLYRENNSLEAILNGEIYLVSGNYSPNSQRIYINKYGYHYIPLVSPIIYDSQVTNLKRITRLNPWGEEEPTLYGGVWGDTINYFGNTMKLTKSHLANLLLINYFENHNCGSIYDLEELNSKKVDELLEEIEKELDEDPDLMLNLYQRPGFTDFDVELDSVICGLAGFWLDGNQMSLREYLVNMY